MVESINRQIRTQRRLMQELGGSLRKCVEMVSSPEDKVAIEDAMVVNVWTRCWAGGSVAARVRRIGRIAREPMSLETPVGTEENSSLADFIEGKPPRPADQASRHLLRNR
jgi:RNA polymerase primary sigma factor